MEKQFANLKHLPLTDVRISGGFWKERQITLSDVTVYAIRDRFRDTGRFDAFRFEYKPGDSVVPHIFWDSDIAKWIEAAAYTLLYHPNEELEADIDEIVELIERHQEPDGYFNIYFTVVKPGERFTHRSCHELYCCGHLIEAAIAYHIATGKEKLLSLMRRYADLVYRVFYEERSAAFCTPGHPEIELALVKLYRHTGEKRYLTLAEYFIDTRGTGADAAPYDWCDKRYAQDHAPLVRQDTAEGHAVRAAYLYSGMADVAYERQDKALADACRRLFENIRSKRMYITGATGSSHIGEAFTIDYDLQNETAYAESCAALALAWFADRMTAIEPDGKYADTVETVLYNCGLSGISLDGESFFYENPLQIDPKLRGRDVSVGGEQTYYPITQRKKVFDCSCCPPNIARFIASVGAFIYQYDADTLYVNQYIESDVLTELNGETVSILQQTRYPANGRVLLQIVGKGAARAALRIPGWCRKFTLSLNGKELSPDLRNGYAYLPLTGEVNEIELLLAVYPRLVAANPNVQEDAGKAALMMGPVVYCLEGVDNGINLRSLKIDTELKTTVTYDHNYGVNVITAKGWRTVLPAGNPLYYDYDQKAEVPQTLRFIPYFAFANRGESEMEVWVLTEHHERS